MFGRNNIQTVVYTVNDPGADNKQLHMWRAPMACEILNAYIVSQVTQTSSTAGEFALHNFGTAGTAIKSTGGTIAASPCGTAAVLTAETPKAYTITEGTLAEGEWVVLDYQENGDFTEVNVVIVFDYVLGIGA